jgi:hypothetical protein
VSGFGRVFIHEDGEGTLYVPEHQLPHCTACGDPRAAHKGLPRRHGAKCTRCDCPGYTFDEPGGEATE